MPSLWVSAIDERRYLLGTFLKCGSLSAQKPLSELTLHSSDHANGVLSSSLFCSRHREVMRSREINSQSLRPAIGIQCIVSSCPICSEISHNIPNRGLDGFTSG